MAEPEEAEGTRPNGPAPPASKRAVRALVRERLSEARLEELGQPECSVCRCLSWHMLAVICTCSERPACLWPCRSPESTRPCARRVGLSPFPRSPGACKQGS